MKGVVLGGTASGVGKTVASLVVMTALEEAGVDVQPAKAGPDFIDPSHHAAIAGRPSRTLDVWMEGTDGVRRNYARGSGDMAVVEGVMGLYDGDASSTAMVADALSLPVVLIVDAKAGMESVAATALGFQQYATQAGTDIEVAGIIAQRAHGGRHEDGIRAALPDDLTYFGRIPPREDLDIPDRHLGLFMGEEATLPREGLSAAAEHIRTDRLLDAAREPPAAPAVPDPPETDSCIALARDQAFSFLYAATRERLETAGTVRTFSPVAGDPVPECDGIYLPGGYPERFAAELEASDTLDAIRERAVAGTPVFGECGGLMALSETLETTAGDSYRMAGVLPAEIRMTERYQALDHVELVADRDTLTANRGDHRRGHEFHYSTATLDSDATLAFSMSRGEGISDGRDGLTEYATLGTYTHVHPESGAFDTFLDRVDEV
ncbi:cobyrinic acid a,c-diamide synthase [Halodesulfurarchaeum formicicum]|uniref:Cobyrinate a,c-diamide synthase n=1 Tax=Halodesulfurarchaeum formicicum TaxID=1873524 RepID=A0A1J1ADW5_9EURY|nr:cobyrinic acid a,c-diamide synthase [Halodesulfurarchaeum formicicum]APE96334.1 cobyrinic acid a,c-diamide synthase [Halodesulfurarchaeum formicicum]